MQKCLFSHKLLVSESSLYLRMDFHGKNVVYVGGYGGIGFATCKKLMLKSIANLVILDIRERPDLLNELTSLNQSVNVIYTKLDLCDKESVTQSLKLTVDRIKYIDILVNGSGVLNEKKIELTVGINLIGLINTNLTAIPYMDKSLGGRGGVIINVSSFLGLEPAPPSAVYSATKHGVIGFTRSLSEDYYYQRTGIMMMAFCPGYTITSLLDTFHEIGLTFPYSGEVQHTVVGTKSQTADECGTSLLKAIECARNGVVWISEGGELKEVKMFKYWECHN